LFDDEGNNEAIQKTAGEHVLHRRILEGGFHNTTSYAHNKL
jgi:hypothetical protein